MIKVYGLEHTPIEQLEQLITINNINYSCALSVNPYLWCYILKKKQSAHLRLDQFLRLYNPIEIWNDRYKIISKNNVPFVKLEVISQHDNQISLMSKIKKSNRQIQTIVFPDIENYLYDYNESELQYVNSIVDPDLMKKMDYGLY